MKNNIKLTAIILGLVAVFVGALGIVQVKANPSFTAAPVSTAAATTTLAFMSAGTGTTTLTYNSYSDGLLSIPDKALLVFQFTASTTNPQLLARVEYSDDNINWYPSSVAISVGTTTVQSGTFSDYRFSMSTTSSGGVFGGTGTAQRIHQSLPINTYTQYTRVVFTIPAGGSNGALWAELLPVKQQRY